MLSGCCPRSAMRKKSVVTVKRYVGVGLREIPPSDAVGALFLPWRQYRQKNAAHRGWQETSHGAANLPGESLIHQTVPNVRLAATGVVNLHLS
jgi:hypothetical protein